ncbi:MAG: inositol monophosphatase family protein, partial [Gaiellaceae bacterium]
MGPDLAFALELADLADSLSLPRFRAADLRVERKPDLSPVTDADRTVERALRERIAAERPGEAVLGEEEGGGDGE